MAMTEQHILDYVMNTPGNTNPAVLKGMLESLKEGDNPDLSFITAGAAQILSGYIGADKDANKVNGSYVPLDTSDADATSADILKDKTAYVNGVKITGTYEAAEPTEVHFTINFPNAETPINATAISDRTYAEWMIKAKALEIPFSMNEDYQLYLYDGENKYWVKDLVTSDNVADGAVFDVELKEM